MKRACRGLRLLFLSVLRRPFGKLRLAIAAISLATLIDRVLIEHLIAGRTPIIKPIGGIVDFTAITLPVSPPERGLLKGR